MTRTFSTFTTSAKDGKGIYHLGVINFASERAFRASTYSFNPSEESWTRFFGLGVGPP